MAHAGEHEALNRLATAQENVGASWTQNFNYDRFGNRTFAAGTNSPAQLSASNNPVINPHNNRIDIAASGLNQLQLRQRRQSDA